MDFVGNGTPISESGGPTVGVTGAGRAWIMLESRKNSKPEKCLKMPHAVPAGGSPQRPVHAVLGAFYLKARFSFLFVVAAHRWLRLYLERKKES
jgi:hypothetical protein